MKTLITGSSGLIGSQACYFFYNKGYDIVGIDNDMRSYFFGKDGSNKKNLNNLKKVLGKKYTHYPIDIRDYKKLEEIFKNHKFDIIIHTAAQPSHDWAAKEPITDFHINAVGTFNLLELTRLHNKEATFIFTSTNKVYGDRPNLSFESGKPDSSYKFLFIKEQETRYEAKFLNLKTNFIEEFDKISQTACIDETMPIDQCKHSIFGASKVSADIMCQEYGKYFNMNVGVFRGGCLTGSNHSGVELHGFLSYLIKCVINNKHYKIFGYKGKQVRDNIDANDLIEMFWHFHQNPRQGEVYNSGGGKNNSISIIEAIEKTKKISGNLNYNNFSIFPENRVGDHIWYISDLSKFKLHYPKWEIKINLDAIIERIVKSNHDHPNR